MSNSELKDTERTALQGKTDEVVISVRNVKKMFRVYRDRGNTLKVRRALGAERGFL